MAAFMIKNENQFDTEECALDHFLLISNYYIMNE